MMLGDILALARRSGDLVGIWLADTDSALAARLEEAAGRAGTDIGGFLGVAVADFTETASEQDWSTLISRLRDADDPGRICALTMIRWRLEATDTPVQGGQQGATP